MIKGFLINLQFFTSIPVPLKLPMDKLHLKKAIQTFPLLGIFQGCVFSLLLYLLQYYTPFSDLADAFFLWLVTIILTGGIHLDGWIDASDAYFSFRDREKRLEIMKDPRTGAFGVISVIVLLGSKFLFIYEITLQANLISIFLIMYIPFLGKSAMGYFLTGLPSAKKEGLAFFFQQAADIRSLWIYPLYLLFFLWLAFLLNTRLFLFSAVMLFSAVVVVIFLKNKIMKWFGGVTGDVLGSAVEGVELLLWAILWLLHYFAMA
ncbi:adenosylcobinamide-GDP ribazoletransferase [Bacillus methanolicus]|uniref:Adenosylcobinamide-GDP ribazoletransferase n=1 Tax=Bacillus methanolicus (strain MGA3 / ATCC 53907) TaxID=796606 RepID=I3E3U1_BACMM|nr:adenosylcobinamide-GDP ribazoletransferase [Bacillus methanolicus]AIE58731.1 cobalamin-5-phosphate synthase CobS [Bacillus methanolicus MGA3]EIJ81162.1 cobalamin-5-phosphate synthase CobS [Bacillus methanolicus MGA3]UQD50833.1 adenosylcobinamide-GDP ribazoletransferase [Bacillus methanolicus]